MSYSGTEKSRILAHYGDYLAQHGSGSARALGWLSEEVQRMRFEVLSQVGNLNGRSVLDVGCGFGDLYGFLTKHATGIRYLGIDLNPTAIRIAKERYPAATFEIVDFGDWQGPKTDVVLASGAFSFMVPDYKKFYFGYIKKMFDAATVAIAFNLLNSQTHITDDLYAAYGVPEVYQFCLTLTKKLVIRQDYLEQDFTVYLYH